LSFLESIRNTTDISGTLGVEEAEIPQAAEVGGLIDRCLGEA